MLLYVIDFDELSLFIGTVLIVDLGTLPLKFLLLVIVCSRLNSFDISLNF